VAQRVVFLDDGELIRSGEPAPLRSFGKRWLAVHEFIMGAPSSGWTRSWGYMDPRAT
jgi:hypothetical protein